MRATAWEFRLRFLIHTVIYVLGFWAPWNDWLHLDGAGPNAHAWGLFAVWLSKSGVISIAAAFNLVLCAGIVCAALGAWLRTWGSAYLGVDVVNDTRMHGDGVVADGPFRYLRNPLYLGTFLHTLALALLMPASGATFSVVLIGLFQIRLILAEEAHLTSTLGSGYTAYCGLVPRLLATLHARVEAGKSRPRWREAVLGEIYFIGVTASFAVFGWWYNGLLLMKCVVVCFGLSLIARALIIRQDPTA